MQKGPEPDNVPTKPLISTLGVTSNATRESKRLKCQNLLDYTRVKEDLPFPSEFSADKSILTHSKKEEDDNLKEFILSYIRHLSSSQSDDSPVPSWAGCHSLLSTSNVSIMQVGFLPYLPYPVTDHSTVYTAMNNFLSVLSQLNQNSLPVVCDEGVFRILAEISLQRPTEFKTLVPMLGSFHLSKAAQHCIGKLIKGSGFEDALVETKVFGLKVVESVLGGTHYVRSLRGLLIVSEVLTMMQWEAFWLTRDKTNYKAILESCNKLLNSLQEKDAKASISACKSCQAQIKPLKDEFDIFCSKSAESSELCRYLITIKNSIRFLQDLVCADRDGNWEKHLLSVQKLLPIFAECDSINYLRYASFYLEKMRKLEEEHPEIHAEFLKGNFVVKSNAGSFNAVAPDMKLEQTIQRSKKSSSGVIGETRRHEYVSEWEVCYHEVLSISNAFRNLIGSNIAAREHDLHHELGGNFAKVFNKDVNSVFEFVRKRGNPFHTGTIVKLHNFVTKVSVVKQFQRDF